ncbi:MAG: Glycosyl transferase family 2 [Parcubacteria group bacterium GW2011_GWA2_31_28]|nr:MAG: Glycosyl transferase family 2 [Parcubacteria group bacterium GW2011_GWA2_31_28]
MNKFPKTAIIIPTYNSYQILNIVLQRLKSLKQQKFFDIFVVDNGSTDKTHEIVKQFRNVRYLRLPKNYFVCKAINIGFQKFVLQNKYKYLLIMAHDVLINPQTPLLMVKFLEIHNDVGLLGASHYEYATSILRTTGHSINLTTSMLINFTDDSLSNKINHFSSMYMLPTLLYEKLGGLDDVLFPMIFEEPDIGERILRNGYKIRCCTKAKIWHPIEFKKKKIPKIQIREDRIYSTPAKTYFFFRNRLLYMSLYTSFFRFLIFYFIFNPVIFIYYLKKIKYEYIKYAINGFIDGSFFALTKNRRYIEKQNNSILNIQIAI